MELSKSDVRLLCTAVIEQAMSDYHSLLRKNKQSACEKCFTYSRKEIEEFFEGEWGEAMIKDGLGLKKMDGGDFLRAASVLKICKL